MKRTEGKKIGKVKIVFISLLFVLAAVIGGLAGHYTYLLSAITVSKEIYNKENIKVNDPEQKKEGYTTIALFGVDARDATVDKGNRSDSVIIITINNSTNEVKLTSIYRDTLVLIEGHGYDKLTHAYSFGGPELAVNTLNHNFDLNITDFITINFKIAENVIDALGGVEVDVQSSEVKWINGYVRSLAREGAETTVKYIDGPGLQTLTGSQAVAYTRIRYTAGGDYKRAKRQRTVINAALKKVQNSDLSTINNIITSVINDVRTNYTLDEVLSLASNVTKYKIQDSQGFPYHVKNGRIFNGLSANGAAVDIPFNLYEDVKSLHYILYNIGSMGHVDGISDSQLNEENGSVNDADNTTLNPPENATVQDSSAATSTSPADDPVTKPFEPSEAVKIISQELINRLYN